MSELTSVSVSDSLSECWYVSAWFSSKKANVLLDEEVFNVVCQVLAKEGAWAILSSRDRSEKSVSWSLVPSSASGRTNYSLSCIFILIIKHHWTRLHLIDGLIDHLDRPSYSAWRFHSCHVFITVKIFHLQLSVCLIAMNTCILQSTKRDLLSIFSGMLVFVFLYM